MSLTSSELNYLVWRYLQESGLELAAYALEQHSNCLAYESKSVHNEIIKRIEPGCLVDLVQKGILYSIAEYRASSESKDEKLAQVLNLFGALLEDKKYKRAKEEEEEVENKKRKLEEEGSANGDVRGTNGDTIGVENVTENKEKLETKDDDIEIKEIDEEDTFDFTTKTIQPNISFPSSISSNWHPQTEVLAYGREDSSAVIVAIQDQLIAESVTLLHPVVTPTSTADEISIVSWAPAGNIIVTSSISGELRAWLPDGKLKNIANTATFQTSELTNKSSTMVSSLIWSESGQYLLSIDVNNQICLWNGSNLNLIQQIRPPQEEIDAISLFLPLDACWLDENKFALTTSKNTIRIFAISQGFGSSTAKPISLLSGHENPISILKFNESSKILASCSDFDYVIKIWHSNSLHLNVELNKYSSDENTASTTSTNNIIQHHKAPIINLSWLDDHLLMSVSIDGVVNIWNVKTSEPIISTNLTLTKESFKIKKDTEESDLGSDSELKGDASGSKPFIIFNAAISSNNKWLVVGDNSAKVSVWDISLDNYPKKKSGPINVLHCLAVYDLLKSEDPEVGICDINWSSVSNKVCVSYKGCESIVFDWNNYEANLNPDK